MALRDVGQRRDLVGSWIQASLEIERNWMNLGTAAELAAEAGDIETAVALGEEALMKCGAATPYCPYSAAWATQLDLWRRIPPLS
jgi:hypothetical protein